MLRIAFFTSIHVTSSNDQDSLLRIAIDKINTSPCNIILFGGDLTNLYSNTKLEHVHTHEFPGFGTPGAPFRAIMKPRRFLGFAVKES
jgi:FOG: WD40-like repeat